MQLAPEPGVHSAHRSTHDQPRMVHAQPFGQQAILRFDHVSITVAWEFGVPAVAWLARFAVPDRVRQNDKKLRRIQRLILPEKFPGKLRPDKLRATASRPMHDENGIGRFALRIFRRFSERSIMETQLRQRLARRELEIGNSVIALDRRRIVSRRRETRGEGGQEKCEDSDRWIHLTISFPLRLDLFEELSVGL